MPGGSAQGSYTSAGHHGLSSRDGSRTHTMAPILSASWPSPTSRTTPAGGAEGRGGSNRGGAGGVGHSSSSRAWQEPCSTHFASQAD